MKGLRLEDVTLELGTPCAVGKKQASRMFIVTSCTWTMAILQVGRGDSNVLQIHRRKIHLHCFYRVISVYE